MKQLVWSISRPCRAQYSAPLLHFRGQACRWRLYRDGSGRLGHKQVGALSLRNAHSHRTELYTITIKQQLEHHTDYAATSNAGQLEARRVGVGFRHAPPTFSTGCSAVNAALETSIAMGTVCR